MGVTRTQYMTFTFALFLLGLLGSMAYRSTAATSSPALADDRHGRLVALVEDLERERTELQDDLAELRGQAADLEARQAARSGLDRSYVAELDRLTMLAGLRAVRGPGVRVTLADSSRPAEEQGDPADYIIHDYDVRTLVNALWAGGAEAVAVNGQRLTHSSAIRCVGATVLVNSARVGSPFKITAIGDPEHLRAALEHDDEAYLLITAYADRFGLKVDVDEEDELELPAYGGTMAPRELRPDPEATGQLVPSGSIGSGEPG